MSAEKKYPTNIAEMMEMNADQRAKNGSLMGSTESFIFFMKGPRIGRNGGHPDHEDRAHSVAKQQQYFCQEAIKEKYKEKAAKLCNEKGKAHEQSAAYLQGLKDALEAIGGIGEVHVLRRHGGHLQKKAGTMSLSKEILEKLKEELPRLLDHWDPNPQSSDYKCVFCNQRPQAEARNGKWEVGTNSYLP